MSRHLCRLLRSWIACPILGILAYWIVLYGSMVASHRANPAIRFLGLEFIAVPILGVIGGLVVALAFNAARAMASVHDNRLSTRFARAAFAGLGLALNGFVAGWILMLPILAIWHSYDVTVPLFLDEESRERSNQWSKVGAFAFGAIAFISGLLIQLLDRDSSSKDVQ